MKFNESDLFALANDYGERSGHWGPALAMLYGIALGKRARRILEVGVWHGGSTRAFLLALTRNWGYRLVSIDNEDRRENVPADRGDGWVFMKGNSLDILPMLGGQFDLVLIDGDHTYETVSKELMIIDNGLVTDDAIILLDDCWDDYPGVLQAFEEFDSIKEYVQELIPYGCEQSHLGTKRTMGMIRYDP